MYLSAKGRTMTDIRPRRIFTSLFSKLLLILLVTGVCVNLLVIGFFAHHIRRAAREPYLRNAVNYFEYIIKDLGSPPALEKAKAISRHFLLDIYYDGQAVSWRTSDAPLPEPSHRWRTIVAGKDYHVRVFHGERVITLYRDNGRFTFVPGRDFGFDTSAYMHVAILMGLLTGVLTVAYLAMRWLLKPVRWLHEGVGQVASGNLDHRVPENRSDQLGDLANAFNQMTDRIRNMLKDRDQLLLDVSHELRTPLTRVKVALEFVPDGRAKGTIREELVEMEAMVTAILEEARLRHGKIALQPVDITELLQGVIDEFEKRRPLIETEMDTAAGAIKAAPDLLKIVFRNTIDNALKYSEPDGAPVTVRVIQTDSETVVSIIDRGSGIPPDELPRIFEPFYRVDKSRSRNTGGYGIGLSLCKTIIDAHNGKIEVDSSPGKGTEVRLRFTG